MTLTASSETRRWSVDMVSCARKRILRTKVRPVLSVSTDAICSLVMVSLSSTTSCICCYLPPPIEQKVLGVVKRPANGSLIIRFDESIPNQVDCWIATSPLLAGWEFLIPDSIEKPRIPKQRNQTRRVCITDTLLEK